MLYTLGYFVFALLLLITVHEFGHFIVARFCGVKVLRFSFGFGKVLGSWQDKRGTEYALSLIPLGGYVKMLDEAEGPVPENERHLAFNNKSLSARVAIVLAGPLFNFLFAFLAFWLVLVIGIQSLAPMVEAVKPGSIVARAGVTAKDEILSLNGKKVTSWHDFQYALMPLLGTVDPVPMTLKSLTNGQQKTVTLPLAEWKMNEKKPDVLASLGIVPFLPTIPPIVGEVVADSPAALGGLQVGDKMTSVNGKLITDWLILVDFVRQHPNASMVFNIIRQGDAKTLTLTSASVNTKGHEEGLLGVRSQRANWPPHWLRTQREAPLEAIPTALMQTARLTSATFALIGRLITGKISLQTISGPVGIAVGAGESAHNGVAYYLSFLALVSISLGVMNLLPIPMLDGGHLLYYLLETLRRRPLSDEFKSMGVYFGLALLVMLMIIALRNDLTRLT